METTDTDKNIKNTEDTETPKATKKERVPKILKPIKKTASSLETKTPRIIKIKKKIVAPKSEAGPKSIVGPKLTKIIKDTSTTKNLKTMKDLKSLKEKLHKKKGIQKLIYSIGRRKSSVARISFLPMKSPSDDAFLINKKKIDVYFPTKRTRDILLAPLKLAGYLSKVKIDINVRGGGIYSQAGACRLGIARALQTFDGETRDSLKKSGFLRRDPRVVERKKYGLRKARRRRQFSKR